MALEIKIYLRGNPAGSIYPNYRIQLNSCTLDEGIMCGEQLLIFEINPEENNVLHIIHYGKTNGDTKTDAVGKIIEDRSLEILGINIGGIEIMPTVLNMHKFFVIWPDNIVRDYRRRNEEPPHYLINNLYLGFNGTYEFQFLGDPLRLHFEQLWLDEIQAHQNQTIIKDGIEVFNRPDGDSEINKEFNLSIYDLERLINS